MMNSRDDLLLDPGLDVHDIQSFVRHEIWAAHLLIMFDDPLPVRWDLNSTLSVPFEDINIMDDRLANLLCPSQESTTEAREDVQGFLDLRTFGEIEQLSLEEMFKPLNRLHDISGVFTQKWLVQRFVTR